MLFEYLVAAAAGVAHGEVDRRAAIRAQRGLEQQKMSAPQLALDEQELLEQSQRIDAETERVFAEIDALVGSSDSKPDPLSDYFGYSNEPEYEEDSGFGWNIPIDGSDGFTRTIEGYLDDIWKSDEGRRVLEETPLSGIVPADGMVSYYNDGTLEINTLGLGYLMFCHELKHAHQVAQGKTLGPAQEREANAWASARCMEAGHPIQALIGGFSAIDPVTNLAYMFYYGSDSEEE